MSRLLSVPAEDFPRTFPVLDDISMEIACSTSVAYGTNDYVDALSQYLYPAIPLHDRGVVRSRTPLHLKDPAWDAKGILNDRDCTTRFRRPYQRLRIWAPFCGSG